MPDERRTDEPEFDYATLQTGPTERPFGKVSKGEIQKLGLKQDVDGLLDLLSQPEASGADRAKLVEEAVLQVITNGASNADAVKLAVLFHEPAVKQSGRLRGMVVAAMAYPGASFGKRVRGTTSNAEAVPALIDLLAEETDDEVRIGALSALGDSGSAVAVPALLEGLGSKHARQRQFAIRGLRALKVREAVPGLIDALEDRKAAVRRSAAFALTDIRDERGVEPLERAANKTWLPWRRWLMKRMARELRRGVGLEDYD